MRRETMDGPPWGGYVDPDEAYVRGQMSAVGSGLLGGWSQSGFGGAIDAGRGVEDEVRRTAAEITHRDDRTLAEPPQPEQPRLPGVP